MVGYGMVGYGMVGYGIVTLTSPGHLAKDTILANIMAKEEQGGLQLQALALSSGSKFLDLSLASGPKAPLLTIDY